VDNVLVELDRQNRQIVIRPVELPFAGTINEGFVHQVAEFIEEYHPTLEHWPGFEQSCHPMKIQAIWEL
jgi:hypothetical protein